MKTFIVTNFFKTQFVFSALVIGRSAATCLWTGMDESLIEWHAPAERRASIKELMDLNELSILCNTVPFNYNYRFIQHRKTYWRNSYGSFCFTKSYSWNYFWLWYLIFQVFFRKEIANETLFSLRTVQILSSLEML